MKKWILIPRPGQFRGEGDWEEVKGERMEADYDYCLQTGYLPVRESEERPRETVDISSGTD